MAFQQYLQMGLLHTVCCDILQQWLSLLCVTSTCNMTFPLPFPFNIQPTCTACGWCILYAVSILLVFLLTIFISFILQLSKPKMYYNTGKANNPTAVIFFLAFNSHFSIILNFLVYNFFKLSFISWYCKPSLSSALACFSLFKIFNFSVDVKH